MRLFHDIALWAVMASLTCDALTRPQIGAHRAQRSAVVAHGVRSTIVGGVRRVLSKLRRGGPPPTVVEDSACATDGLDEIVAEALADVDAFVKRTTARLEAQAPFAVEKEPGAPVVVVVEEPAPYEAFDAAHARSEFSPLLDELLAAVATAPTCDAELEWRLARAHLDVADAKSTVATAREQLVREGLAAARRAVGAASECGLSQKWFGIMLGSVGDYETTKAKIANSFAIKQALDVAEAALPNDATVQLALGQWAMKVAGVSFMERNVAKALFGEPPASTFADSLRYFQRAEELKPAVKTKALIKLVTQKL